LRIEVLDLGARPVELMPGSHRNLLGYERVDLNA
jgi:hypothetical protein